MRIALAQLNSWVGDVDRNAANIAQAYAAAVDQGADLVLTGELSVTGYPPDDLLLKPAFIRTVAATVEALAGKVVEVPLIVGFPEAVEPTPQTAVISEEATARRLANAAAVLRAGKVERVYRKQRIPNYGVFDEARYFQSGTETVTFRAGRADAGLGSTDTVVGVTVCEDLWGEGGAVTNAARQGAKVVLNGNASPFHVGKRQEREHWARHHATTAGTWIVYLNIVGGQDDVVFDGDSFVMAPDGSVVARAGQFVEDLALVDLDPASDQQPAAVTTAAPLPPEAAIYEALVLGTQDYLTKNGFERAVIGVSGGIDSALTATVATDALGPDQVTAVAMPSPYSSPGSLTDAKQLATNLGCRWLQIGIDQIMQAFDTALAEPFAGTRPGVAEENIQSRIRGTLLMALSNKRGDLVLATGNKSEYAVGYATLYGDMAGGFAPLKDVYKTVVYDLCRYRNAAHRDSWRGAAGAVIPQAIIDKPPSAELRPGQRDTDSLPPYDRLDAILQRYVEGQRSVEDITGEGFPGQVVTAVVRLVDRAEYKRSQAAPGIKVTSRAFGRDRRLPITQSWTR